MNICRGDEEAQISISMHFIFHSFCCCRCCGYTYIVLFVFPSISLFFMYYTKQSKKLWHFRTQKLWFLHVLIKECSHRQSQSHRVKVTNSFDPFPLLMLLLLLLLLLFHTTTVGAHITYLENSHIPQNNNNQKQTENERTNLKKRHKSSDVELKKKNDQIKLHCKIYSFKS